MHPRTRRTLAGAAALALGGATVALTTGSAQAAPVTETFEFSGAPEDFVVPEGVCEVTVDAFGASGGPFQLPTEGLSPVENGPGLGGRATATIEVTPGETLIVRVGGEGEPPSVPVSPDEDDSGAEGFDVGGAGGFNGGGDAGSPGGAGGGGASDVRQGGDGLDNRVVVAGGGGGWGEGLDDISGGGGDGGGLTGEDGQQSSDDSAGGGGGTQTAGGAGGAFDPTAGDGTFGQGGVGGDGTNEDEGGGGGGGGWYGGGGGAGDLSFTTAPAEAAEGGKGTDDGGGGGGGSGFGPPGTAFETGVQEGNGLVTITYDPAAGTCEPDVAPDDELPDVVEATPPFTG